MRSTSIHPLNVQFFPQSIFSRNKIKKKAKHKNIKRDSSKATKNFLFGYAEFIVEVKRRKGKTIPENDFATERQRRAQTWGQG